MTTTDLMVGSHDYRPAALSILISILAAYAANSLVDRLRDARGRLKSKRNWLALHLGCGHLYGRYSHFGSALYRHGCDAVQGMHHYDITLVILSVALAIVISSMALGLTGMRERAIMLGERLWLESAAGLGTMLRAEIPMHKHVPIDDC